MKKFYAITLITAIFVLGIAGCSNYLPIFPVNNDAAVENPTEAAKDTENAAEIISEETVPEGISEYDLPDFIVTDEIRGEVEYIKNFPVIYKSVGNDSSMVFCTDMSMTYKGGKEYYIQGYAPKGFAYIFRNLPDTGDRDKDFYITQMAVWYFADYLHQDNNNLVSEVKKYLIYHAGIDEKNEEYREEVSELIYALYEGAKEYEASNDGSLGAVYFYRSDDSVQDLIYPECVDVDYAIDPLARIHRMTSEESEFDNYSYKLERRILFEKGTSEIANPDETKEILKPYVEKLLADRDYSVILGGMTESREADDELELARASEIGKLLCMKGVDSSQIYIAQLNKCFDIYAADKNGAGEIDEEAAGYNRCCIITGATDNNMAYEMVEQGCRRYK